jgi:(2Fe-2S) ferredoxin
MGKRITSPGDLAALREEAKAEVDLRMGPKDLRVTVHMGTCGIAAGAREVLMELVAELGRESAQNVTVGQSGCAGLCDQEPMLTLADKTGREFRYGKLNKAKVHEIVRDHILGGKPATAYLIPS